MKYYNKASAYFKKNPHYNASVHTLVGIGIGILATYPLVGQHPMRWGVLFLSLGILGHLLPILHSK